MPITHEQIDAVLDRQYFGYRQHFQRNRVLLTYKANGVPLKDLVKMYGISRSMINIIERQWIRWSAIQVPEFPLPAGMPLTSLGIYSVRLGNTLKYEDWVQDKTVGYVRAHPDDTLAHLRRVPNCGHRTLALLLEICNCTDNNHLALKQYAARGLEYMKPLEGH